MHADVAFCNVHVQETTTTLVMLCISSSPRVELQRGLWSQVERMCQKTANKWRLSLKRKQFPAHAQRVSPWYSSHWGWGMYSHILKKKTECRLPMFGSDSGHGEKTSGQPAERPGCCTAAAHHRCILVHSTTAACDESTSQKWTLIYCISWSDNRFSLVIKHLPVPTS